MPYWGGGGSRSALAVAAQDLFQCHNAWPEGIAIVLHDIASSQVDAAAPSSISPGFTARIWGFNQSTEAQFANGRMYTGVTSGKQRRAGMSERRIERVIANTINNAARGDPEELAGRIVAALADAGYYIAVREDTGSQSFDKLTPDKRPQRSLRRRRGLGIRNRRTRRRRTRQYASDNPRH